MKTAVLQLERIHLPRKDGECIGAYQFNTLRVAVRHSVMQIGRMLFVDCSCMDPSMFNSVSPYSPSLKVALTTRLTVFFLSRTGACQQSARLMIFCVMLLWLRLGYRPSLLNCQSLMLLAVQGHLLFGASHLLRVQR